jgi:F-type H+-transporting ATPase subunit beta
VETGIKTIDLFAPLVRGGTAGLPTLFHGLGQLATVAEVLRTLATRHGFSSVVWLPEDVQDAQAMTWAGMEENVSTAQQTFRDMVTSVAQFFAGRREVAEAVRSGRRWRDVAVVADRGRVESGELLQLKDDLAEAGSRPVTYILYDPYGAAADADAAPFGPLDSSWRFDVDMRLRDISPAIDPVSSISSLLENGQLEATHISIAGRARRLLRRYRELRPGVAARGLDKFPADEQLAYRRGERLEAFMTQPYFVTEAWSKLPGARVALQETLAGARRVLDGEADAVVVDALRLLGRLPDRLVH